MIWTSFCEIQPIMAHNLNMNLDKLLKTTIL